MLNIYIIYIYFFHHATHILCLPDISVNIATLIRKSHEVSHCASSFKHCHMAHK